MVATEEALYTHICTGNLYSSISVNQRSDIGQCQALPLNSKLVKTGPKNLFTSNEVDQKPHAQLWGERILKSSHSFSPSSLFTGEAAKICLSGGIFGPIFKQLLLEPFCIGSTESPGVGLFLGRVVLRVGLHHCRPLHMAWDLHARDRWCWGKAWRVWKRPRSQTSMRAWSIHGTAGFGSLPLLKSCGTWGLGVYHCSKAAGPGVWEAALARVGAEEATAAI